LLSSCRRKLCSPPPFSRTTNRAFTDESGHYTDEPGRPDVDDPGRPDVDDPGRPDVPGL
jgi:hypothetical protein